MKTLILWIDAFRPDYLSKDYTPFLYKLSQKYWAASIKPSFGFSQATWFTGLYPEDHGELCIFNNQEKKLSTFLLNFIPKKFRGHVLNFIRYLNGKDLFIPIINLKQMAKFSATRDKYYHHPYEIKTIFDNFRKNKISYLLYYWPLLIINDKTKLTPTKGTDFAKTKRMLKLIKKHNCDVYMFKLSELDTFGHAYGPKSERVKIKLREQDFLVERIVKQFNLEKDNILIWSDHGMLDVKGLINLEEVCPENEKYLRLIESTTAKFWFKDEEYKKEILSKLKKLKKGHILSKEELKKFKINFKTNENFEEIFLADPEYLICPNVFQEKPIKGMHGYDYSQKGELAFLISNNRVRKQGEMVDILPTILELLHSKSTTDRAVASTGSSLLLPK